MKVLSAMVGPIMTNCYILCDEADKLCAVIDPGGDASRVAAAVAKTGCAPCAIPCLQSRTALPGCVPC